MAPLKTFERFFLHFEFPCLTAPLQSTPGTPWRAAIKTNVTKSSEMFKEFSKFTLTALHTKTEVVGKKNRDRESHILNVLSSTQNVLSPSVKCGRAALVMLLSAVSVFTDFREGKSVNNLEELLLFLLLFFLLRPC